MARTRASRGPVEPDARQPQSRRATLARHSKPSQPLLDTTDSVDDGSDKSEVSLTSESDSEDEFDGGKDRSMGDLDIHATRRRAPAKMRRGRRSRPANQTVESPGTPKKTAKRGRPAKRTPTKQTSPRGRKRGRPSAASTPSKKTKTSQPVPSIGSGIIPNWLDPKVPYSAWVDIFYYAAMASGAIDNSWLVHAASICKGFLEPALAALYRCPSPSSSAKAKKLAAHLMRLPTETIINYPSKVESLYIDTDFFTPMSMAQLAVCLPRLWELIPFTRFDQPPYRQLDRTIRWGHSPSIFKYMADPESESESAICFRPILKSWEWSGRLLTGGGMTVDNLIQLHESVTFAQLTKVGFTNFQVPSLKRKTIPSDEAAAQQIFAEDDRIIDTIAYSITKLTHLKHLIFESSTVVVGRLLNRLPEDLVHLQLINCWEVTSADLNMFLSTHGRNLRSLTLHHNQSLDLAFLTDLATNCPNLQELRMNMSYYRLHDTVNDSDPMYDQALLPDQLPLWPPSLRIIEIENIRQWSVEAAEMFLQSLIDSAPNLTQLRHLSIKTMLDVPWQRRAEMRQGWTEKFDAVFLRPWVPPETNTTLRGDVTGPLVSSDLPAKKRRKRRDAEPARRSGRIAAHNSDSDQQQSRRRTHSKPRYIDPDTDADELSSEGETSHDDSGDDEFDKPEEQSGDQPLPFQGLCESVDIMFDNQKVRELQYGMEDFEDDQESSGEEWVGDTYDDEDTYAW